MINTEISTACSYVNFHIHFSLYVSIQIANLMYAQNCNIAKMYVYLFRSNDIYIVLQNEKPNWFR